MNLEDLNHCDIKQVHIELLKCCGSSQWTEKMLAARPYKSESHLLELAGQIWSDLGEVDYLEAFAAHPKIGESKISEKAKNTENWTQKEQAGMMSADVQTKLELVKQNRKYEEKFGYIFIVCATGKSASGMLELLRIRLENSSETELKIAAGEQMKITNLRLNKMLRDA